MRRKRSSRSSYKQRLQTGAPLAPQSSEGTTAILASKMGLQVKLGGKTGENLRFLVFFLSSRFFFVIGIGGSMGFDIDIVF